MYTHRKYVYICICIHIHTHVSVFICKNKKMILKLIYFIFQLYLTSEFNILLSAKQKCRNVLSELSLIIIYLEEK